VIGLKNYKIIIAVTAVIIILSVLWMFFGKTTDVTEKQSGVTTEIPNENIIENAHENSFTLSEDDAFNLISEKIDEDLYNIELMDKDFIYLDQQYYIYSIYNNNKKITPDIAVNIYSGEILCCTETGEIVPYSEFPLYDPTLDAQCDWNGTFENVIDSKTKVQIELAQSDKNSFEFTVNVDDGQTSLEILFAFAKINGNTAKYEHQHGLILNFIMLEGGVLEVSQNGENLYILSSPIDISGRYSLVD